MQFSVEPAIFARFPGLRIAVAMADGVDNALPRPAILADWHAVWRVAGRDATQYGNAQSHPRVRPWRERFRAMGVSGKTFPSSVEALVRRALKGDAPVTINPLVDFYNTVSLRHTVPAGGFDLDQVRGPLELRLTRVGDRFVALDADAPLAVPPGEIAYADGPTILTRHFVWRQARAGLIAPATRAVVLLSEVPGELGGEVAEAVLADFDQGVRTHFGVAPATFLVEEDRPDIAW